MAKKSVLNSFVGVLPAAQGLHATHNKGRSTVWKTNNGGMKKLKMAPINPIALNLIRILLLINLSCSNNEKYVKPRSFFNMTKSDYYDKSLDSLEIIGHFGLDSIPTKINNSDYWKFRNSKRNLFIVEGMLRNQGDTIFILTPDAKTNGLTYCKEQVLFIFNAGVLNKSWTVEYSCNTSLLGGIQFF